MSVLDEEDVLGRRGQKIQLMTTFVSATPKICPFILRNVISCIPDDSVACTASSSLCEVFIYFSIGAGVLLDIIKPGPAHTE